MQQLAGLVRPGGHLLVLDYLAHDDESMREEQADLWLGFSPQELQSLALQAGLEAGAPTVLPPAFHPGGPDAHLSWQLLAARRLQTQT
jgi:ArsR family transcriptional regulator